MKEFIQSVSVRVIIVGTVAAPIGAINGGGWWSLTLAPACWLIGTLSYMATGGRL